MNVTDETLKQLRNPFSEKLISWRVGSTNADKTRGQALPYIDNRNVQNRLDDVVGPSNWTNRYEEVIVGDRLLAVRCIIGVLVGSIWVEKEDAANLDETPTNGSRELAIKGVYSDAMKRAAVQWGIGRYLYDYAAPWVALDERHRLCETPHLPAHMVPAGEYQAAPATTAKAAVSAPAPVQASAPVAAPAATPAAAPASAPVAASVAPVVAEKPVQAPAAAPAPTAAPSAAAQVLQPPTENAGQADALVDAHVAQATARVAPAAAVEPAKADEADAAPGDALAGLTAEQKALVDDLLAKIEKLPPKMIRAYITGPKGQEKLTAPAREFLLKKVAAKEALAEQV